MRNSLPALRRRLERLAKAQHAGCQACRSDEARSRFAWESISSDAPQEATCPVCRRTYTITYVVVRWMRPGEAAES